jgi:hypothetical protein
VYTDYSSSTCREGLADSIQTDNGSIYTSQKIIPHRIYHNYAVTYHLGFFIPNWLRMSTRTRGVAVAVKAMVLTVGNRCLSKFSFL